MWSLRHEGFDFCIHVDTIRNFLLQWEKGDSKGGPSRLAGTSPKRVRHSYKGQGKRGSLSTGQRTHENVRLNAVGQNEQLMHKKGENKTGGSFFARQYSEDISPGFSAFSLSDDCSTLEDRRTGTTLMLDDNAKCVDGSHLSSELNRIMKSNTYTKITMQKDKKPERHSERKGEVPESTVSKLSKSGLTKKNELSSSSLKRKTLEVWNMLTKVEAAAKELLASCITNNNAAMVLNHPMYSEKIRALESFVRMQVTELELEYQSGD